MTTIGYARVSTTAQDEALQVDALTAAGCPTERIYVDHVSGATTTRPQLGQVLDYARAGDTIVVWRLDRLGRSLRHLIETVTALDERGIGFKSITESIDTTTPGGRLLFHIFGAIAEFERDLIRERTTAGLQAARARGRHGGRPRALSDAQLEHARQLYDDGDHTAAEIAALLGVARSTLYRGLAR